MFQSNELVYIQVPKTGGTHVAVLLSHIFHGRTFGKHKPATEEQLAVYDYFVSSIRNPWEWYLSLWTFGVNGKGSLMRRVTTRALRRSLKEAVRSPRRGSSDLWRELSKNVYLWRDVYHKGDDVGSFRKWLKFVHDSRYRNVLGEGYGNTVITGFCGFMTYRYLYLCCRNAKELSNPELVASYADLVRFERENCYIHYFIRQESLEDDLCKAVEKVRPLTQEEKSFIYDANKTNTSKRSRSISDYYDEESIELILDRERLLVEKYGYAPPGTN